MNKFTYTTRLQSHLNVLRAHRCSLNVIREALASDDADSSIEMDVVSLLDHQVIEGLSEEIEDIEGLIAAESGEPERAEENMARQESSATPQPKPAEDEAGEAAASVSQRNSDISLLLSHVHGTLDLLNSVARCKDSGSDIESLCVSTLDNALDGMMREIERVGEFVNSLPCSAPTILMQAIAETERLAESAGKDKERYQKILQQMARAHTDLETVTRGSKS
jgi:hypothetical protein